MSKRTGVLGAAIVAILVAGACVAVACSGAAPSCNSIQAKALAEITNAAASVPQCVVDADCKPINIPGDCLDCVNVAGNDNVRAAVAARTDAVAAICASYHSSGCILIPSGCPNVGSWTCEGGMCAAH
jgi:hypothetical protein